jgi:microcystin-dependent protein
MRKVFKKFVFVSIFLGVFLLAQKAGAEINPMLGEIMPVGFNFCPRGWLVCDGQILPINQYQSLFSLLGTTYGGDGRTTFALPDLRGRMVLHQGNSDTSGSTNHTNGQRSGAETHTLTINEIPQHKHAVNASTDLADNTEPEGSVWASQDCNGLYSTGDGDVNMSSAAISPTGGSYTGYTQAHENMPPFLTINYCIAIQGLFPSQ